jgi:hypothetical protein
MNTMIVMLISLVIYFAASLVRCAWRAAKTEHYLRDVMVQRGVYAHLVDELLRQKNNANQRRLFMRTDLSVKFTDSDHVTIMQIPGYTEDGHRLVITVVGTHKPTLVRAMNALVLNSDCHC